MPDDGTCRMMVHAGPDDGTNNYFVPVWADPRTLDPVYVLCTCVGTPTLVATSLIPRRVWARATGIILGGGVSAIVDAIAFE